MDGGESARENVAWGLPDWVPDTARYYLAHTEAGCSIRQLARGLGVHASTVLRQIRRVEARRDDPLVDSALNHLGAFVTAEGPDRSDVAPEAGLPDNRVALGTAAVRVLRRLCETGAVLAVADGMDKAIVARDGGDDVALRTAVVECGLAQAMALLDWIACGEPARISRYRITAEGRMALGRLLAEAENRARTHKDSGAGAPGMAEAPAGFDGPAGAGRVVPSRRSRYGLAESPLAALARRKDRDGKPFLDDVLVNAGERLREDFELARMGAHSAQDWDRFLTGGGRGGFAPEPVANTPATDARDRVTRALAELGPGLSDVALRCCCYLEGLELAEKKMGWSARSGKIVLRIALQRLRYHYETCDDRDRMIG